MQERSSVTLTYSFFLCISLHLLLCLVTPPISDYPAGEYSGGLSKLYLAYLEEKEESRGLLAFSLAIPEALVVPGKNTRKSSESS